MGHFAGLDVSVKETSVCIVDDTGRIVREAEGEIMRGYDPDGVAQTDADYFEKCPAWRDGSLGLLPSD